MRAPHKKTVLTAAEGVEQALKSATCSACRVDTLDACPRRKGCLFDFFFFNCTKAPYGLVLAPQNHNVEQKDKRQKYTYPALCHLYKVENQVKLDDSYMCDKTVTQKNKTVTGAKFRVVIIS